MSYDDTGGPRFRLDHRPPAPPMKRSDESQS